MKGLVIFVTCDGLKYRCLFTTKNEYLEITIITKTYVYIKQLSKQCKNIANLYMIHNMADVEYMYSTYRGILF